MAYCAEMNGVVEYTYRIVAFLAIAPAHSMSRSASPSASKLGIPGSGPYSTNCGLFAGRPNFCLNVRMSARLISLSPTTTIFCPEPSKPA